MIQLKHISFSYPGQTPLFEDFSWQLSAGSHWSVVGPSGCGKTTLLFLLSGLLQPADGDVVADGTALTAPIPQNGLVFQTGGLLPWATLKQNVEIGLRIRRCQGVRRDRHGELSTVTISERAEHWLETLGLDGLGGRFPAQVSGGQRQRAAIARTLATDVRRLFLDEPFTALDEGTRSDLRRDVLDLCHSRKLSLVVVTHSVEEAAMMGENVLVFHPGGRPGYSRLEFGGDHDVPVPGDAEWVRRCKAIRQEGP